MDFDGNGNVLVTTLDISDNFVVNAEVGNLEDVDFWLVCCTKQSKLLHEPKVEPIA